MLHGLPHLLQIGGCINEKESKQLEHKMFLEKTPQTLHLAGNNKSRNPLNVSFI